MVKDDIKFIQKGPGNYLCEFVNEETPGKVKRSLWKIVNDVSNADNDIYFTNKSSKDKIMGGQYKGLRLDQIESETVIGEASFDMISGITNININDEILEKYGEVY